METLAPELRNLVSQSVALLGLVIQHELGQRLFNQIEDIRQDMVRLRELSEEQSFKAIENLHGSLSKLSKVERREVAHSYTLMLELMNACENAYRSYRISVSEEHIVTTNQKLDAIIYVLTAHPTEARAPLNIAIFHQIQNLLLEILKNKQKDNRQDLTFLEQNDLRHLLEVAWRVPIVRERSPRVKDEAEHIYSLLFRDDVLFSLLDFSERHSPFFVRTWVGGDKDGHPGVDEKVLLESLTLSRGKILHTFKSQLKEIKDTLVLTKKPSLTKAVTALERSLNSLKTVRRDDSQRVKACRQLLNKLQTEYKEQLGAQHPALRRLRQLCYIFPGLVVPLELRESSDVLMAPEGRKKKAIEKMLDAISSLSRNHEPRWYARGFIISMTESMDHIKAAAKLQKKTLGAIRIPIIPLFEESSSLADADKIVKEMIVDKEIHKAAFERWDGLLEMMVGYSDSAKEAGSLSSRLAIAEALPRLEKVCQEARLTPVFFHGSGGSIDRGGGSIEDQTAWWPRSALRRYKCTIQGEMVERSLATADIARRQVEKIYESAARGLLKQRQDSHSPTLDHFAREVSAHYHDQITSPEFLEMVTATTPYSFLSALKIGSRPTKRTQQLTVAGLRAIPWVLCWTQTRVLFQTWWGIGSAWEKLSESQKKELQDAFQKEAVFTSYVKALGFTLAKVELAVWRLYLEKSSLSTAERKKFFEMFQSEYSKTVQCFQTLTGQKELLWFRRWLGESIYLRSPMIHPLNVLQILAKDTGDMHLLRVTVTGISSGMLTTG